MSDKKEEPTHNLGKEPLGGELEEGAVVIVVEEREGESRNADGEVGRGQGEDLSLERGKPLNFLLWFGVLRT